MTQPNKVCSLMPTIFVLAILPSTFTDGGVWLDGLYFSPGVGSLNHVRLLTPSLSWPITSAEQRSWSVLHRAARSYKLALSVDHDTIGELLDAGASIEARTLAGYAPLHMAAASGQCEAAKVLLSRGARPNPRSRSGATPLWVAAVRNLPDGCMARVLVEGGADLEAEGPLGTTPLVAAAMFGTPSRVRELLELGADVDARRGDGATALQAAVAAELADLALMLDYGAQVAAVDGKGRTALHLAARECNPGAVAMLLDAGAEIEARDEHARTALHHASAYPGCEATFDLLVARGADVNARDDYGTVPLHLAATFDRVDAVRVLLASGADVNARDKAGRTAVLMAAAAGSAPIVWELERAGADITARDVSGVGIEYEIASRCSPTMMDMENYRRIFDESERERIAQAVSSSVAARKCNHLSEWLRGPSEDGSDE